MKNHKFNSIEFSLTIPSKLVFIKGRPVSGEQIKSIEQKEYASKHTKNIIDNKIQKVFSTDKFEKFRTEHPAKATKLEARLRNLTSKDKIALTYNASLKSLGKGAVTELVIQTMLQILGTQMDMAMEIMVVPTFNLVQAKVNRLLLWMKDAEIAAYKFKNIKPANASSVQIHKYWMKNGKKFKKIYSDIIAADTSLKDSIQTDDPQESQAYVEEANGLINNQYKLVTNDPKSVRQF